MALSANNLPHSLVEPRRSLRRRLLKLAFIPLLATFLVVLLVLALVGGGRYDARLEAMVNGNLSTVRTYLDHQRKETETYLGQQVKSERLRRLLAEQLSSRQLDEALISRAAGVRLDFLILADRQGRVIASSTGMAPGSRLSHSFVLQQAITGVLASGFEVVDQHELSLVSPRLSDQQLEGATTGTGAHQPSASPQSNGLALSAAAPFPLSNDYPDAVLYGGILLNNDIVLIDHIRDVVFPIKPEAERINGIITLFINDERIVTSLEPVGGESALGTHAAQVAPDVLGRGTEAVRQARVLGNLYLEAYAPLVGADGKRLGMMAAGIPLAPYRNEKWLLIGSIAGLLSFSMLGVAVVFQRGTRSMALRLEETIATMKAVREGRHGERIPLDSERDEITLLGAHFNELLDALQSGKAAQAAAQQTAENEAARRRTLFEHEQDGLVVLNDNGAVYEANPSFVTMLGYAPEELSLLHIWEWDTRFGAAVEKSIPEMLAQISDFFETRYLRKDGSSFVAEVSKSRIEWSGAISYLLIIRDITERDRYEREREQAKDAADEANRAKSEFLANVSHEIRTPMNGILGMTHLLRATPLTDEQAHYLDVIKTSSNGLLSLINDVLDLSKIESGRMELEQGPFCLRDCIREVIDSQIYLILHKGLHIETDIAAAVPDTLIGDQLRLKQILLNLVGNAVKFTDSGGVSIVVTVSARRTDGVTLLVKIIDSGIGIRPELMNKLFEPFTQADASTTRRYGGTGLGLSICTRLTTLMGGRIWGESQEGAGCTFCLELPFTVDETVSAPHLHRSGDPVGPVPILPEHIPPQLDRERLALLLHEIEALLLRRNMAVADKVAELLKTVPPTGAVNTFRHHVKRFDYDRALSALADIYLECAIPSRGE